MLVKCTGTTIPAATEHKIRASSRMAPAPQNHPTASVPNLLFESQTFRQAAWSQNRINQAGMRPGLAAQSEPNTYTASQKQSVTPRELYKTQVPVESPSPPPDASNETEDEDENEALLSPASGEDEGQDFGELPSQTPAERRAEKRRMKRFRHILMLHKGYAYRERYQALALDKFKSGFKIALMCHIRRAKLKRLTGDDQESMLKSRALPADFDTAQALNSVHNAPHSSIGGPSSFYHPPSYGYDIRGRISSGQSCLAEEDNGNISPTCVISRFGDSHPTSPASISLSETFSSISPSSERTHFFTPATSQDTSPRVSGPSTRSSSFPTIHHTTWHRHEPPLQQRLVRSRAGSLAFPVSHTKSFEQSVHNPNVQLQLSQSHLYSQQNLTNPNVSPLEYATPQTVESVMDGYVTHGSTWPSANGDFITSPPTNRSSSIDGAGLRLDGPLGTPSQTQQFQPVARQLQSAPLAEPPQFHPADWTKPCYAHPGQNMRYAAWDSKGYQQIEASVPAALDYSQGSQAGQIWLPDEAAPPCQMFSQHSSSFEPHATPGINYSQGNITPQTEPIERWQQ
ncbi:MAG: hypothetical protein Q9223_003484 [Gallowayella weberi]